MAHDHFTLDGCEAPLPVGEGFGVRERGGPSPPAGAFLDISPSPPAPLPAGEGRMPTSPLAPVNVKWS